MSYEKCIKRNVYISLYEENSVAYVAYNEIIVTNMQLSVAKGVRGLAVLYSGVSTPIPKQGAKAELFVSRGFINPPLH